MFQPYIFVACAKTTLPLGAGGGCFLCSKSIIQDSAIIPIPTKKSRHKLLEYLYNMIYHIPISLLLAVKITVSITIANNREITNFEKLNNFTRKGHQRRVSK